VQADARKTLKFLLWYAPSAFTTQAGHNCMLGMLVYKEKISEDSRLMSKVVQ